MIVKLWVFFGRKFSQETYILSEIKKKELDEELEARSIEITDETKPKLVEHPHNWYDSLFPLHKYNCNVLLVVDDT
jgi:hypothetical protein